MKKFTLAALAVACLSVNQFAQAAYVPEGTKLAEKQEYRYNQVSSPDTLDPSLASYEDSFAVIRMLFDTLVRQDSRGDYIPWGAESWQVSKDGLTWTFNLRKNATWSNGKPITASDYVYSWQRLTDPKTGAPYGDYLATANVVNALQVNHGELAPSELGVKAVDDYTLEVKLTQPTPWFAQMLALAVLVPLPQETIAKHGDSWTNPDNIVTSGPFLLKTYLVNNTMDFEKNEKHFDAANTVITKVHFDFINNPNSNYYKYLTGEYPVTNIPVQFKRTVLQERPEEVVTLKQLGTYWLKFNNEKVTDPRVRTALALLVNRAVFTNQILGGNIPTAQITPPNIQDGQLIKQADWLNKPQAENNKKAVELLTAAGYSKDKPLVVNLLQSAGGNSGKYFVALQGWFRQGTDGLVELRQDAVEGRTVQQRVARGEYEVTISGWIADYDQVTTFFNNFTCNSPLNEFKYCNPEYDKVLSQASLESDAQKRQELYAKANDILLTDMPVAPLFNIESLALKSPALQGYNPNVQQRYINDYYFVDGVKAKGVK
ncbi:hypothetical protein CJP74_01630 [Psittacicella melopsittaci]|uniref:Solute-binding protein family 5 domain-containing protein n=1 Tax=Psittacicella melopsittaci TaxID=2028576 RepID=A0A3A1Y5Q3_9GAMM|nr:peptide ABC transporter substrate-binding protein [Psittacicella melopsittaci]RIY33593.1 hypothetical protein CJP74_01630 [Psittacicella melopsittaci]